MMGKKSVGYIFKFHRTEGEKSVVHTFSPSVQWGTRVGGTLDLSPHVYGGVKLWGVHSFSPSVYVSDVIH